MRRRRFLVRAAVSALLASTALVSAALGAPPRMAAWSFTDDFSHGIPAWMSYPLAQDVGYDPSIYTANIGGRAVLERDVAAAGQQHLLVGLLRPLQFHASAMSHIRLTCEIRPGGTLTRFLLMLGTTDGKRYTAPLPIRPGIQRLDIPGSAFGFGAAGADVDVVVIEANVDRPIAGSHNRLIVSAFSVQGQRVPAVEMVSPRLLSSATGEQVASEAIAPGAHLRIAPEAGAAVATVSSPDGKQRNSIRIVAGTPADIDLGPNPMPGLWRAQVASANGRSDFRFLVIGATPPHPRVLFGACRLQQLRTDPALSEMRAAIHRKAAELANSLAYNSNAGENIVRLSPDSVFPGLVPYFALMDSYANAIGYNALDYRLNGNPQALNVARRALLVVSDWPTWTPPWFAAHGLHTYYEAGIFTQRVAFGYDLIADDLSAADRERIAEAFWKNEIAPAVQEYFVNDRLPIAASNHMAHTVGGALAAALAVAGDTPDWNTKFAPAVGELLVAYGDLLRGLFPGDGSEAEPAGYENFALQGLSWGAAALDSFGIHPPHLAAMLNSFWWIKYAEVRPDLVLDTGDFNGTLHALAGFAWPAEYSRNPTLRDLYARADHGLGGSATLKNTGRALEEAPDFLDLACCTWPEVPAPEPPPSRIFLDRGSAILRSGWNDDATVISLRAGPWFNHEHHDQGSFQVAAFGEKLVGEAGYANYYTDPRYDDYFTQAPGHNTVVLDDNVFSQEASDGRYWPGFHRHARITRHLFSPGIDYVAANLADAYDGALQSYTREYLFLKPDVLLVRDRIGAPRRRRFIWLLHVPAGAHATTAAAQARIIGKRAAALVTAADEEWTQHSTPIPIDAYGNLDREQVQARSMLSLSTPAKTTAGFLVGLRFVQNGGPMLPLQVRHEPNAEGFALHEGAAQTLAMFRTGEGKISAGDFASDAEAIVATTREGIVTVFASSAREIHTAKGVALFSASAPSDVSVSEGKNEEDVSISTEGRVDIKLSLARPPKSVLVDEKSFPISSARELQVQLAGGEHVLRIR